MSIVENRNPKFVIREFFCNLKNDILVKLNIRDIANRWRIYHQLKFSDDSRQQLVSVRRKSALIAIVENYLFDCSRHWNILKDRCNRIRNLSTCIFKRTVQLGRLMFDFSFVFTRPWMRAFSLFSPIFKSLWFT